MLWLTHQTKTQRCNFWHSDLKKKLTHTSWKQNFELFFFFWKSCIFICKPLDFGLREISRLLSRFSLLEITLVFFCQDLGTKENSNANLKSIERRENCQEPGNLLLHSGKKPNNLSATLCGSPATAQLEIWPQRPMYFAATIAIHHSAARGVALTMGGGTFHRGVAYPWGGGFDFGPYLVEGWQGGGIHGGGGSAKPKVLLLAKPLELQYYLAPFPTAVLWVSDNLSSSKCFLFLRKNPFSFIWQIQAFRANQTRKGLLSYAGQTQEQKNKSEVLSQGGILGSLRETWISQISCLFGLWNKQALAVSDLLICVVGCFSLISFIQHYLKT